MRRHKIISKLLPLLLMVIIIFVVQVVQAQNEIPVVQAVLFYSNACPHCHQVIKEVLPPIFEKYGAQLAIFYLDVQTERGLELYQGAIEYYDIPDARIGVPTLIVGGHILVGSGEIPDQFSTIIDEGLQAGGIPWPDFPGLEEEIENVTAQLTSTAQAQATEETKATETPTATTTQQPTIMATSTVSSPTETSTQVSPTEIVASPTDILQEEDTSSLGEVSLAPDHPEVTMIEKFKRDLVGNIVALFVLAAMVWSLVMAGVRLLLFPPKGNLWPRWAIPLLSVVGLVVAGYLSYVEITLTTAVCGPVGDCNTVQQSQYARLFGVLPIGVLGMAGYFSILLAWFQVYYGEKGLRVFAVWALFTFTLLGTVFSIYLTFLEPFVIGATCAWCLASAVIITLQFWAASGLLAHYLKKKLSQ